MAKAGQKRKRAEKAKTGLKTSLKATKKPKKKKDGIRLAKGLNETKVDVSGLIRTLAVRGQDQAEDKSVYVDVAGGGGDHKKRLRDVGELVIKLGHHAYSQRVEGLTGLQDWMKYGGGISDLLSKVVVKSLSLIVDVDSSVRRECAKFLGLLLQYTPPVRMEPLREAIGAHLCCGLSHIDPDIQRDALKVLDEVTAHAPRVVAACAAQVLPSCIEQIASSSSATEGNVIRLKSDLSNKVVMGAWRLSVFQRLENVLRVVSEAETGDRGSDKEAGGRIRHKTPIESPPPAFASLFCGAGNPLPLSEISSSSDAASNLSSFDMAAFSSQLASVLLDTWREVAPVTSKGSKRKRKSGNAVSSDNGDSHSSSLLSKDAVDMLDKIVAILHFLASDPKSGWRFDSDSEFRGRFLDMFVQPLPFHAAHQDSARTVRRLNLVIMSVYLDGGGAKGFGGKRFVSLLSALDFSSLSREELKIVSSIALNLSKTSLDQLDSVAADLSRHVGRNPDVADLLCDLCESNGSSMDCTKAWINSVIPIIGEGKASRGHFRTVEVMLKRNDEFAKRAFCSDKLAKELVIGIKDGEGAYAKSVRDMARVLEYYVEEGKC